VVRTRYASADFQSLSAVAREVEALRRGHCWRELIVLAGRRRRAMWRGVRAVQRLDRLELPLSSSPAGDAIWRTIRSRQARVARAVLQLPDDPVRYQSGRARQALRTNVHHADALGISCRELGDIDDKSAALDRFLRNLGLADTGGEERYLERVIGLDLARQQVHVAVDPTGDVVAIAALEVDVGCGLLVFLHGVAGQAGAAARYALSLHVVNSLIDERVSFLLVGGTVRLAPGLQYFQQRLGFEIFNVRPVRSTEREFHQESRFAPCRRRTVRPSSSGTGVGGRVP
jgi:hypothetical protein